MRAFVTIPRQSLLLACAGLTSCAIQSELETTWEVPTYAGTPFIQHGLWEV